MTVLDRGANAREQAMTVRDLPHLAGVEHRFLDVGGLRTHVALAGSGEPLLLLHGWPQHWWQWRHLIGPLAQHFRVICPDLRGLGWTDAPASGYRPAVMADDISGQYRWSPLRVPTLVVIGSQDPLLPVTAACDFGSLATDIRFEVFEDAGHFPATEQPERVAALALEFFGQKSPLSKPSKPPKSP